MNRLILALVCVLCASPVAAQSTLVVHDDMLGPYMFPFEDGVPQPLGFGWDLRFNDCDPRVVPLQKYSSGKAAPPGVNAANTYHPRADGQSWLDPGYCKRLYTPVTAAPLSPDGAVEGYFEVEAGSSNRTWQLAARVSDDGRTMYMAGWYLQHPNIVPNCYILKIVNLQPTPLALANNCGAIKVEQTGIPIKFDVQGNKLELWINGVRKLTATNSDITAAGYAGFGMGNWRVPGDTFSEGGGIFEFKVWDYNGVVQPPPPPSFSCNPAASCTPSSGPFTAGQTLPTAVSDDAVITVTVP